MNDDFVAIGDPAEAFMAAIGTIVVQAWKGRPRKCSEVLYQLYFWVLHSSRSQIESLVMLLT